MTDEEINYQTKRIKIEDVASYNKTIFETICKRKVQIFHTSFASNILVWSNK